MMVALTVFAQSCKQTDKQTQNQTNKNKQTNSSSPTVFLSCTSAWNHSPISLPTLTAAFEFSFTSVVIH